MPRYIDANALVSILNAKADMANTDAKLLFSYVAGMVNHLPAADVVEVATLRSWLYEIAINNVGCALDGDFSTACEEIISRLDGLRNFARERKEQP